MMGMSITEYELQRAKWKRVSERRDRERQRDRRIAKFFQSKGSTVRGEIRRKKKKARKAHLIALSILFPIFYAPCLPYLESSLSFKETSLLFLQTSHCNYFYSHFSLDIRKRVSSLRTRTRYY